MRWYSQYSSFLVSYVPAKIFSISPFSAFFNSVNESLIFPRSHLSLFSTFPSFCSFFHLHFPIFACSPAYKLSYFSYTPQSSQIFSNAYFCNFPTCRAAHLKCPWLVIGTLAVSIMLPSLEIGSYVLSPPPFIAENFYLFIFTVC